MKRIEFLPESYRRRDVERRARLWEYTVVGAFGSLVLVAACYQLALRWNVAAQEAITNVKFMAAEDLEKEHARVTQELSRVGEVAELITYLKHPWPRTQILNAVTECLPEDTTITRLRISREAAPQLVAPMAESATTTDQRSSSRKDLDDLRKTFDACDTILWINGTTRDGASVYLLADKLGRSPLVTDVKIESVGSEGEGAQRETLFRMKAKLRPGYGQAGGPSPATKTVNSLSKKQVGA